MLSGKIKLPGDKSISHRAALFGALLEGKSIFTNFNLNDDCKATLGCLQQLGIKYELEHDKLTIYGKKQINWEQPKKFLDAQNSGTTARLMSGLLASLPFSTTLIGDSSLSKRPMERVVKPLRQMGAKIEMTKGHLPLKFEGNTSLHGIEYPMPIASAQVKSAILLAGLSTKDETKVIESAITRDHTERILNLPIKYSAGKKEIRSHFNIKFPDLSMEIPGDFSSAAFFICAALVIPDSDLKISRVSLNPTRTGLLNVLELMGGKLETVVNRDKPEPIGSIKVRSSTLTNIKIPEKIVPNIIDEIPILAILATQAKGAFILRNAEELRFKESDRIDTIVKNLRLAGIEIEEYHDGFSLSGPQQLKSATVKTHGDHRIAMAFTIANAISNELIEIDNPACASVSFPNFYKILTTVQTDQ